MIYLQLFFSFLQIGALSFGGGYAAMPLIQEQVVTLHGWLSMEAFTVLVTIAEMTPGPIAVNSATFVGIQIAGPGGAVVATLGCIPGPPVIIVTLLSVYLYEYRNMSLLRKPWRPFARQLWQCRQSRSGHPGFSLFYQWNYRFYPAKCLHQNDCIFCRRVGAFAEV